VCEVALVSQGRKEGRKERTEIERKKERKKERETLGRFLAQNL
jgi:hypothetical protein